MLAESDRLPVFLAFSSFDAISSFVNFFTFTLPVPAALGAVEDEPATVHRCVNENSAHRTGLFKQTRFRKNFCYDVKFKYWGNESTER